jgi:pilus assembly protein CpaE
LDVRSLANYIVDHDSGVRVIVGAARPEDGERVGEAHVRAVLGALRRRFLVTVVDCGTGLGKPTLAALDGADRIIVVCTPELTTLRDVRECQRILGQTVQGFKSKVVYVLNHPIPAAGLSRVKFEAALDEPIALEVPYAGEAAARAELSVGAIARAGRSPYGKAVDQLASLLGPPADDPSGTEASTATHRPRLPGPARRLLRRVRGDTLSSLLVARHGR